MSGGRQGVLPPSARVEPDSVNRAKRLDHRGPVIIGLEAYRGRLLRGSHPESKAPSGSSEEVPWPRCTPVRPRSTATSTTTHGRRAALARPAHHDVSRAPATAWTPGGTQSRGWVSSTSGRPCQRGHGCAAVPVSIAVDRRRSSRRTLRRPAATIGSPQSRRWRASPWGAPIKRQMPATVRWTCR